MVAQAASKLSAGDIIERWRELERRQKLADPESAYFQELESEIERVRDEYQRIGARMDLSDVLPDPWRIEVREPPS